MEKWGVLNLMKVLFMIPTFDPGGGAEKVLLNLVNNMDYSKFDITILALFGKDAMVAQLNPSVRFKSIMHYQFRGNSKIIGVLPSSLLYRLMIKEKYDVVVSYLEGPTCHIVSGCKDKNTKKVAWIHTDLNEKRRFMSGFGSVRRALSEYQMFDKIVCVSNTVRKNFQLVTNGRIKTIDVVYNTNDSHQIVQKANESLIDIEFCKEEINLISVGKIIAVKGFDRLARVHKRLVEKGYNHHVYIVGAGENKKEIVRYLKENGIEKQFTFLGFRDNPYKYVKNADLYVCSSHREGFSTAVTEALIVGTPICTVEVSGMKEMLGENNEYGVVTENSEDALYEGIKNLIDNPELLAHYKKQAQIRGKTFSTENTVRAVEEMLLSL